MNLSGLVSILLIMLFGFSCMTKVISTQEGAASFYADFFHGQTTASGETYDSALLSAAHLTLPFGTEVRVTNLSNQKAVVLRINDRGPFIKKRILDLSKEAARELDFLKQGVIEIRLEVLRLPDSF